MPRRSPNADIRSPTDEACLHEDTYRPSTQAESDAAYAAFKAGDTAYQRRFRPTLLTTAKAGERAA